MHINVNFYKFNINDISLLVLSEIQVIYKKNALYYLFIYFNKKMNSDRSLSTGLRRSKERYVGEVIECV